MFSSKLHLILLAGAFLPVGSPALAADLHEPITLASDHGVLDLLMIAKAAPVRTLPGAPTGWVYEICKRPQDGSDTCPATAAEPNYYGGTRLQLQKGDTLRIHLVNELPPILDSEHAEEPGHEFLGLNPTNLHTHGMLVSTHRPSSTDPTYGDNVFVLTFNSMNGKATLSPHMHSDVRYDSTDYEIRIPASHPSGLFWFHPHAHGISLNQITAGMSGIITVGNIADYVCNSPLCSNLVSQIDVRHMIIKDTQLLPNGTLQTQEDPDFCPPTINSGDRPRQGACDGQDNSGEDGGSDYRGGKWFVTLNGQPYPTVKVKPFAGEIWRLTNASGSASYDLSLWNPAQNRDMLFQVISLDGVSVDPDSAASNRQLAEISGGKFKLETCPAGFGSPHRRALCTRRLFMMPSSRAEVWVTYRDAHDRFALPPARSYVVFRTRGYQTGPSGDYWPAVDLARVEFKGSPFNALPGSLDIDGEASAMLAPRALSRSMAAENQAVAADKSCHALPPGHMRRIFYGVPMDNPDGFGLAYEEIDENGNVVGEPATDVSQFNPMKPTVCVQLGPGNAPATERWQLVNVATEDHNFHIHQTKFRVLGNDEIAGTLLPDQVAGKGLVLDNVPLPHASGTCGNDAPDDLSNPIADWRAGLCHANIVTVAIPFTIAGDFVYHCHILEHEDGGMMARIRVRPNK